MGGWAAGSGGRTGGTWGVGINKDMGKNIPMAANNTIKAGGNLGKAFKKSVAGDSVDGLVSDYKGNIRNQELTKPKTDDASSDEQP